MINNDNSMEKDEKQINDNSDSLREELEKDEKLEKDENGIFEEKLKNYNSLKTHNFYFLNSSVFAERLTDVIL